MCLIVLHGATEECLFEDNVFLNGGRGKTGGAFGNPGPTHDLWLHTPSATCGRMTARS